MITASFGIATYPSDGTCQEELIRHADKAMYQAKRAARDRGLSLDIQKQAT
jgi:GGDEF domain-containing protein